jgi:chromosome segregation protein
VLKLKRVEIQGFKSFVDRTEMRFAGAGIAAIVGPNGCGKSNLSDAISWVLGEQSAKSLRGSRMEDVIFAGTRDRRPVGLASVTMTLFDPDFADWKKQHEIIEAPPAIAESNGNGNGHSNGNGNGHNNGHSNGYHEPAAAEPIVATEAAATEPAPATHAPLGIGTLEGRAILFNAHGEITITRRLYRSGESEYMINGRIARLRDIQDLFMGSGLGPESYAIIEQGRIGQILSNKPQDRRAIIEEAAGVTKFKTKKRLAEAKLEGAKQNLSRVFDILEEVGRQVNSLKRQAAKAKRYDELRTEMIAHLKTAISGRYRVIERDATKLALELSLASDEFSGLSTQVGEQEGTQAAQQEQFYSTEQALTAERAHLSEAKLEAERTRSKLELQSKQVATIEERLTNGEAETKSIEDRAAQLQIDLATQTEALAELNRQTDAARNKLTTKGRERDLLGNEIRNREQIIENTRHTVLKLLGEASTLKNQLAQVAEYLSSVERDKARIGNDEQTAVADLTRLEQVKSDLSTRMSARQLELQSLADQRKSVESDLGQRKQLAGDLRRKLDQLKTELSRQRARRDSLEEVISHRSYTTDSVKRLFKDIKAGKALGFKPVGVLADFVEVADPSGAGTHEKAIEEFLHEELEYVVVHDWNDAEQGVELMRTGVDGRATFLVEPGSTFQPSPLADRPAHEGIVASLADVLRFTNGLTQAPAQILPRLANCFLVGDRSTARDLAAAHPSSYFLTPDGISFHGQAVTGGKKSTSGPLALKRELRELADFVEHRQREVNETSTSLEALESEMQSLSEELERIRHQQQVQEKDALVLDQEVRKMKDEHQRSSHRLSVARLELDRLQKEGARSADIQARNSALVVEREAARTEHEQHLEALRSEHGELQSNMNRLSEEHAALRADLAGLEERRRNEQSSTSRLDHQLREATQRKTSLAAELERLRVNRAQLTDSNGTLNARAAELAGFITEKSAIVQELASKEELLRTSLTASEELLKQLRADSQSAQERRSSTELELVRKQAEMKYLEETAAKELNATPAELTAGDDTEIAPEVLLESEAKYKEVKHKIDNLGPVNPQALEEFEEASQRYEFLSTQRQDLLDSIKDTEKAIQDLDGESRKRFVEAFEAINVHFREMFKVLFGGGVGEMRLTDESNLSDCGIDIVSSPPGKKLQNVLLLSGGEKSLTAMALLMAIFKYQPSPFCVLDEVDAPLDEANIVRLTNLLKEMSSQTQFVVITHAKRTMEVAASLYGVTMQEPGVSKLVSVRFQPIPEAAEQMALAARG